MNYIHNRKELVGYITDRVAEIRESFPGGIPLDAELRESFQGVQSFPDLHHELFNTDYYIVGTYQAEQWLGDYAFDAIGEIQKYEEDNFVGASWWMQGGWDEQSFLLGCGRSATPLVKRSFKHLD